MSSPAAVLWLRTILFTVWSALLALAGMAAIFGPASGGWIRTHGLWLGTSAVCAGLFVFMAAVADRWFPSADRRLVAFTEGVVFLALFGAGARFVVGLW
ncbi:MAG: hypothetical protein U0573_07730 [Phycisphaerales bacterium]|nr:hypothetical protein [Planctomycetota bacterium]